jgi:acyl-CoA thioester hydrolase
MCPLPHDAPDDLASHDAGPDAAPSAPHETRVSVRSYELDSFGHLNHAVYLNHFEHARFQALAERGFSPRTMAERNEAVHVVRIEVDYRAEAFLGQEMVIRTRPVSSRTTSMVLHQEAAAADAPERIFADARVVAVWIGPDGRPVRIPDDVRRALGLPT